MKFVSDLFDKVKAAGDYYKKRNELRHLMFQAVSDGVLSDGEIQTIEARCRALNLPPEEITNLKLDLYQAALKNATADRRLTAEEEASLKRIADHYQIPPEVVEKSQAQLARYRLLQEIELGNLPRTEAQDLELKPGETVHWAEPASLIEERVVSREYVAHGPGITITKGVSFKVGGERGEFKTKTEMVTVSTGTLFISNQRLILAGDQTPLEVPLPTIANLQLHHDTIVVTVQDRTDPYILQIVDPNNMEVFGGIFSRLINTTREPAVQ
ncbi:MAG TPA: hypothetical protein VNT75_15000 [Symbiobacteriaceae bacterium]|nr:hypothetical protein [Symbiobacteriaceae bacterium]